MKETTMKTIILMLFLFSATSVLAEVDEDCLCTSVLSDASPKLMLAIDSCIFQDKYNYEFECKNIFFSQRGSHLVNNIDSNYMYGRRNILISSTKPLFENYFNEVDTLQSIENIKNELIEVKEYFEGVAKEFGGFEFYSTNGNNFAALFFNDFQSLPALKYYFSKANSIFSGDSLRYEILSYTVNTSNIETNNQNSDLSINGNVLISGKEAIESVTAYDLYGREVESYENINSNSLNLSGLKGAYILQVKTNNTTHTIKYFDN